MNAMKPICLLFALLLLPATASAQGSIWDTGEGYDYIDSGAYDIPDSGRGSYHDSYDEPRSPEQKRSRQSKSSRESAEDLYNRAARSGGSVYRKKNRPSGRSRSSGETYDGSGLLGQGSYQDHYGSGSSTKSSKDSFVGRGACRRSLDVVPGPGWAQSCQNAVEKEAKRRGCGKYSSKSRACWDAAKAYLKGE